jgi:hypothetical protein
MVVLDTDELPVDGGTFHDTSYTSDASGVLIDGAVDVDVTRAARRTFNATLLNNFGEWSPQSDWSGLFYVDRLVQLYRGFVYPDGLEELVPIGLFLIDHADVTVERNMSIVVLSGTDKWKKLSKDIFTRPYSWASGTPINDVISDIIVGAGVTSFFIDPLVSRTTDQSELNTKLVVDIKDNRGDVLWKLAQDYGLDMYFDPSGVFTTAELSNPADQPIVYTFTG